MRRRLLLRERCIAEQISLALSEVLLDLSDYPPLLGLNLGLNSLQEGVSLLLFGVCFVLQLADLESLDLNVKAFSDVVELFEFEGRRFFYSFLYPGISFLCQGLQRFIIALKGLDNSLLHLLLMQQVLLVKVCLIHLLSFSLLKVFCLQEVILVHLGERRHERGKLFVEVARLLPPRSSLEGVIMQSFAQGLP